MKLEDLGYNPSLEKFRKENQLEDFGVGRVTAEHKERYIVKTCENEFEGEITGHLRYTASDRTDFPVVGDWVSISEYDTDKVLIHKIFPRKTLLERQAVGKFAEKQVIAANIDTALIVMAVDRDFKINRIERYFTICNQAGIKSYVVLSKIDLITEQMLVKYLETLYQRTDSENICAVSNITGAGYDKLKTIIKKGNTYCLMGSSGVGKSTLINNMSGNEKMRTGEISAGSDRGKHITSHREMILLQNGGLLIDNPGIREVGTADEKKGLNMTFEAIIKLARKCKYKNCTHMHESGCAVLEAVKNKELDKDIYNNFIKMEKEQSFFEMNVLEKKQKDKNMGKIIKNFKKDITKVSNKYKDR